MCTVSDDCFVTDLRDCQHSVVFSPDPSGYTTIVKITALPIDAKSETPLKALLPNLISSIWNTVQSWQANWSLSTAPQAAPRHPSARTDAFTRWSACLCWQLFVVYNCFRQIVLGSTLQNSSTLHWTLSHHLDDISHSKNWPSRSIEQNTFGCASVPPNSTQPQHHTVKYKQ